MIYLVAALPSDMAAHSVRVDHSKKHSHHSRHEEHIVMLTGPGANMSSILHKLDLRADHTSVRYTFQNSVFSGFVANLSSDHVTHLTSMPAVLHVEQTLAASVPVGAAAIASRLFAPWGLQRISSNTSDLIPTLPNPLNYTYTYDDSPAGPGAGVDIYVVDTGIYTAHAAFDGRATNGWSAYGDNDTTDSFGHGTHVAGTAAGDVFGIASAANLVAVKVLGDDGTGTTAHLIAGFDYIVGAHDAARNSRGANFTGSVMSLSLGTPFSRAINTVIGVLVGHGIHAVMAAGNDGADACNYSPSALGGSNSSAISVGSIGQTDVVSSFSNTGPCVDVYAPGEGVYSAWIGSQYDERELNGTSMATPHVTGVMAYLMAQNSTLAADPALLKKVIVEMSLGGGVLYNGV